MILIAGIAGETPIALAIAAAERRGLEPIVLDQRQHEDWRIELDYDPFAGWRGRLIPSGGAPVDLNALTGIYARLMDSQSLCDEAAGAARAASFHALLNAWLDVAPCRVANRPRAMMSNMSKPYQAAIIRRYGFAIPETLITNDPEAALDFVARCASEGDEVVYKSVSATRSIVQTFRDSDRERLARIRWCPTQFQRRVRGVDIRVHVVGGEIFATRIESDATDYRYAHRSGLDAELTATELPARAAESCRALAAALDLPFTGIDLRVSPDGDYSCFEANPSPAYSYYENHSGAPISDALIRWLEGGG